MKITGSIVAIALFLPLLGAPATASTDASPGFYNGADWIALEVDPSRIGVRFDPSLDETTLREKIAGMPAIDRTQELELFRSAGRTIVLRTTLDTDVEEALEAAARIRGTDGVLSASPRFFALEDPYYLTEEILVRWLPEASATQVSALTADLVETDRLEYSRNPGHVYRTPHGDDPLAVANALYESGLCEFAIPDFQLYRVSMATTNDPLYGDQWHLESIGQNGAKPDADIDVEGAWDITRGDPGVIVAVVDTGTELGHPDLVPNLLQGIDVLDDDSDPSAEDFLFGLITENHGTSVCGVASGAGNNGLGSSGVAQHCGIIPIRFLSEWILSQPTIQDEADAFNFARQNGASVVNNSWGPSAAAPLPASTRAAIDDCNQNGRNGLGMVVFFAAGNSGADNSGNGYTSYSGTVSVTSVTDQEFIPSYSSFGASTDVCAPSNGGVNGITTTDRLGSTGYDSGDYTNDFGGTSSASPCASGVMLLVLSANPLLTRQEALDILRDTAEKVDLAGGNYQNGHSIYYGYGRVNAEAAVLEAVGTSPGVAFGGGGVGNPCPCSNNNDGSLLPLLAGCDNGQYASGASLDAQGDPSISHDTVVFTAMNVENNSWGLFFQGNLQNLPGIPLGTHPNGLLQVQGQIIRFGVVQANASGLVDSSSYVSTYGKTISSWGGVTAGETRSYQYWYRNTNGAAPCTLGDGGGSNSTNGYTITWLP